MITVLFDIYAKAMIQEALSELEEKVRVRMGRVVKMPLRSADNKALVCSTTAGLQRMISNLN